MFSDMPRPSQGGGGGITLNDLDTTNKTLYRNVTMSASQTVEFVAPYDLVFNGRLDAYYVSYFQEKTRVFFDDVLIIDQGGGDYTDIGTYRLFVPSGTTVKITTGAGCDNTNLNFYEV